MNDHASLPNSGKPIRIVSRGSALALAQANYILDLCQRMFPQRTFEVKVIKTTGDQLQNVSLTNPNKEATKGLFTKELEIALIEGEGDMAVHSLKDLPTELPEGLVLGAVSQRADVRDVLVFRQASAAASRGLRGFKPGTTVYDLPGGAVVATSSVRRQAQLLALRPDLQPVPIRGNVGTRLRKLHENPELDAIILAAAGLERLNLQVTASGELAVRDSAKPHEPVPEGLSVLFFAVEEMLPCVGQAALGIEVRQGDPIAQEICAGLNEPAAQACVLAERAFLRAMGGGCLSPVAAYAEQTGNAVRLRAVSFRNEQTRRAEGEKPVELAEELGREIAGKLL